MGVREDQIGLVIALAIRYQVIYQGESTISRRELPCLVIALRDTLAVELTELELQRFLLQHVASNIKTRPAGHHSGQVRFRRKLGRHGVCV